MRDRSEYTANLALAETSLSQVRIVRPAAPVYGFATLVRRLPTLFMIAAPIAAILVIAIGA